MYLILKSYSRNFNVSLELFRLRTSSVLLWTRRDVERVHDSGIGEDVAISLVV